MKFRSIALAMGAGVFSDRLFIKKLVTRGGREPKAGRATPPAAVRPGPPGCGGGRRAGAGRRGRRNGVLQPDRR